MLPAPILKFWKEIVVSQLTQGAEKSEIVVGKSKLNLKTALLHWEPEVALFVLEIAPIVVGKSE